MLTSFAVSNFRGFSHLQVRSLARVNLIGGRNGAGKTALLEAVYLLMGAPDPRHSLAVNRIRGIEKFFDEAPTLWRWLFRGGDFANPIVIEAEDSAGSQRRA